MTDNNEVIRQLQDKSDEIQTQVYIVAGVLGGVCAALFITVFILIGALRKLNKKMKEAEESRRIAEEIQARKFSAYTGEEVNRRLKTAIPTNTEGEYAFNYPTSEYALNIPPGSHMK